jgi:hypothetical protein
MKPKCFPLWHVPAVDEPFCSVTCFSLAQNSSKSYIHMKKADQLFSSHTEDGTQIEDATEYLDRK